MSVLRQRPPTWERRHAWVVALIVFQAAALAIGGAIEGVSAAWSLLPALTIAGPAVATAYAPHDRRLLALTSAGALLIQAVCALELLEAQAPFLLLVLAAISVVALYEDGRVLALTVVLAAGVLGSIAIVEPHLLALTGGPGKVSALAVVGIAAIAVTAAALGTLWADLTRVRHIALEQRRSTDAYLQVAGTMLIVLDREGRVVTVNRHTCLTLDREEDELVGHEWFELALPEEYREEARRLYALSYRAWEETGQISYEPFDYENEVEARDGERRTVTWWATMLADLSGRPVGMVCSGTDVTQERADRAALERSRLELQTLRRLAQKVASLDDSRQAVVTSALDLTGAVAAAIFEPDRTRGKLKITASTRPELIGHAIEIGVEPAIVASCFLSGQPHFVADCTDAPGINQSLVDLVGCVSLIHQPIAGSDGTIGVITVAWDHRVPSLQERKAELVGLIAHETAISLRRRETLVQLERAALVDPLTGVANRRAFDAELPLALRRADEGRYPLCLVALDLNDFKAVNDEHGHEAGDDVLVRAASAWADVLRAGDLLARLGGDEFAVLLPQCDEPELRHIISRLKRATPHRPGSSMGGAVWDRSESASSLIRRADRALYADKATMKSAGLPHAQPLDAPPMHPRASDPRADAPSGGHETP